MNKPAIHRTLALAGAAAALVSVASAPASAAPLPAAAAPTTARPSGAAATTAARDWPYSELKFNLSGKIRCVDVPKGSKKRGVKLQLWDCNKKAHQKWGIRSFDGPEQIRNRTSGLCLNVAGGSKAKGARVIQWTCSWGHTNSLWHFEHDGDGWHIINDRSRQCLTVNGNSTKNGAWLIQWPCRKNLPSQRVYWFF